MYCRSDGASVRAIFVDFHEVAESHGKHRFFRRRERIDAELVFEPRDQHGEAERVRGRNPDSTRSSRNGARILPCSRAISSIWPIMVNFTDITSSLRFVHFAPIYSSNDYDQVHELGRGQHEWFPPCRQSAADRSTKATLPPWPHCCGADFRTAIVGFWDHALNALARREPPPGLPKYGYLMESGGAPVGAILMICSAMRAGDALAPRCNLSSWYVEPAFRTYAPLLVSQALRHKEVTYTERLGRAAYLADHRSAGFFALQRGHLRLPAGLAAGDRAAKGEVMDARLPPAIADRCLRAATSSCNTPNTAASACGV